MDQSKIKVFLVEDHNLVKEGVISLLEMLPGIQFVGDADNGRMALRRLEALEPFPDVILTDLKMPVLNGIGLIRRVRKKYGNETKIIALTMMEQGAYVREALKAGADGYLLKDCDRNELSEAITRVYRNENYFSVPVTRKVMDYFTGKDSSKNATPYNITDREKQVLRLVLEDQSNDEIAGSLNISKRTVESHKQKLLSKTRSSTIAGLVVKALKEGIAED